MEDFQIAVYHWMQNCFGEDVHYDMTERNFRFIEEALELAQACGCEKEDILKLVDYVYDRPIGEKEQEVGGVMITLAALCHAGHMDLQDCAYTELARVWKHIVDIRTKWKNKPIKSPLPGSLK